MSKWRPVSKNCLYVIPDIYGQFRKLKIISNRILPLRKSDGGKDRLVFLGNYIDKGKDAHKVLDFLIDLKEKYKDRVILLRGHREAMLFKALNSQYKGDYDHWYGTGGEATVIGYLERNNLPPERPFDITKMRFKDLIPKEHINFIENKMVDWFETDNIIFVHAGMDLNISLQEQDKYILYNDKSMYEFAKSLHSKNIKMPWDKLIVTGHNSDDHAPLINEKFLMLDCSTKSELLVGEVNSFEFFSVKGNNSKLVKFTPDK